jgi:multiple sugar transport system substrate-binding protein
MIWRAGFKILALVMMFALLIGVAGAQDDASPSGEITFVFWDNTTETRAGWEAHVARFNEQFPDITVNLIGVPGTIWADYLNGTATLIAGGETPDIIWVATEGVRFLVDLDLMLPLDDMIAEEGDALDEYFDDIAPSLLDGFRIEDQLYFLPYSWNNMVIYYNKNMFDAAGLEYPSDDWTRDDFLAAAQALSADNDGDGNNDQYGFSGSGGSMFFTLPWVFANGVDIVSEDFCAPNLTDPGVMEAVQFIHDMIYEYQVAPAPGTITNTEIQFINGEIGMFGAGRWTTGGMYREGFEDYDIAPWPGNPDQTTEYGVDGFGIFQTSENVPAAWEFLKYMSSADVQEGLIASVDSGSPLGNIPALRSVAEQMSQFPPENYEIFYGSLDGNVRSVTAPPRFNELESIFIRYVDLVLANEMTVEDAMNAAQTELMSVVSCS